MIFSCDYSSRETYISPYRIQIRSSCGLWRIKENKDVLWLSFPIGILAVFESFLRAQSWFLSSIDGVEKKTAEESYWPNSDNFSLPIGRQLFDEGIRSLTDRWLLIKRHGKSQYTCQNMFESWNNFFPDTLQVEFNWLVIYYYISPYRSQIR